MSQNRSSYKYNFALQVVNYNGCDSFPFYFIIHFYLYEFQMYILYDYSTTFFRKHKLLVSLCSSYLHIKIFFPLLFSLPFFFFLFLLYSNFSFFVCVFIILSS